MTSSHPLKRFLQGLSRKWPAKAIALAAAIILYLLVGLTGLEERYITVPIRVVFPENLVAGQEYSRFVRVYLRGEPDNIFSITENHISITADFSAYDRPGIFRVALAHQRLGEVEGMEELEVRLEPGVLGLTLEQKTIAEVDVVPLISTNPAAGYELTSYTTIPSRVQISGPSSAVEGLLEVGTEAIDLSSHNNSLISRVSLTRPHPLVGFENTSVVEFRAEINESILVNTFDDIPVSIIDLRSGLRAELGDLKGSIRAQASQSLIDQTSPESIGLVVDGGAIRGPGEYTLSVRPVVPRGFVIFRFDPVELLITIEESRE